MKRFTPDLTNATSLEQEVYDIYTTQLSSQRHFEVLVKIHLNKRQLAFAKKHKPSLVPTIEGRLYSHRQTLELVA